MEACFLLFLHGAFYYPILGQLFSKLGNDKIALMQKIMTFMPILFGVMLYNYAAGLSLYMITSSLIGIIEAKYIKKKWPVGGTPPSDAVTG